MVSPKREEEESKTPSYQEGVSDREVGGEGRVEPILNVLEKFEKIMTEFGAAGS